MICKLDRAKKLPLSLFFRIDLVYNARCIQRSDRSGGITVPILCGSSAGLAAKAGCSEDAHPVVIVCSAETLP